MDETLKTQLKSYFEKITTPIEIIATLTDDQKSQEMRSLLEDVAAASEKIDVRFDGRQERKPAFVMRRKETSLEVGFAGLPMGHEFTSFILAALQLGGVSPKESPDVLAQIQALEGDYHFETYFSLTCQNCPDVVQALNVMSVVNPKIRHTAIDGALFQNEIEARQIMGVPAVFLNGAPFAQGRISLEQILAKLDAGAAARSAQKLTAKEPFDVLVVGGGPAGAAAAIYAARKGLRVGLAAERFGGQVLDTLGIENLIAVPHTEGLKLAATLERNVRDNGVDILTDQTAVQLSLAETDGLNAVEFAGGARLTAKTIILAPGARWRLMNVPGEDEYRTKGVAFCPHCDGPLFKGKKVAVIGGGNSGVEAAIDLAGLAAEVVLIEFEPNLCADAVLQTKLRSLANVKTLLSAQTTQVLGDGVKVSGLHYRDRVSGHDHRLDLDGVFVQIGLIPNTEWLRGVVDLTSRGEIIIDARAKTSVNGVFAAGDATTSAYKQIVIAMGEGATAALSAFDHLIRSP